MSIDKNTLTKSGNKSITNVSGDYPIANIRVTSAAANQILKHTAAKEKPPSVRIRVTTAACSLFKWEFEMDDCVEEYDHILRYNLDNYHFIQILIDKKSHIILQGSTLDYGEDKMSSGFKIDIPNKKSECGCGESFSV